MQVNSNNTFSHSVHHFCADASELGLAPGQWPELLTTNLGNGRVFAKERVETDGAHVYYQEFGCIRLTVLND